MKPGDTILGLDFQQHLWIVLSHETVDGQVAVANLTTHGRSTICGPGCVTIHPGEHAFVVRESCIYFRGACLNPLAPLAAAREQGTLRQHQPLADHILLRIQNGALASRFTSRIVKQAIRATLDATAT